MKKPEFIRIDDISERRLYLLDVASFAEVSSDLDLESRFFICLVVANTEDTPLHESLLDSKRNRQPAEIHQKAIKDRYNHVVRHRPKRRAGQRRPRWVRNNMRKTNVLIIMAAALQLLPCAAVRAESIPRPFLKEEYPPDQFKISTNEVKHGNLKIMIRQAKRVADHSKTPYACRAWLDIEKSNKSIFSKFFDDIDPVGSSYGLLVPKVQSRSSYLAIVKNGDYDGRLFLVRKDGKVIDLIGGFYFLTKDKRYLFSDYASDTGGLAVFDLITGKVLFSSERLPSIYQWYEKNGTYFFTESEWRGNSGKASEKAGIVYIYDFTQQRLVEKKVKPSFIRNARIVKYDCDPREYEDCTSTPNTPVEQSR
jgi:hypothetical protein